MNYIQILILAVIQGAAELLPISSSAHVILATTRRLRTMLLPPAPTGSGLSSGSGGESIAPLLSRRTTVWIGLIQGLCLPFRGFSRSGATISMALVCGTERKLAEDFSFALAVVLTPPVIGRG